MFTHLTLYLITCIVFVHCYLFKSRTLKSLFNFPPRYSMHACLYNFTYAEVGKVVTPGLAAKSSFRWPLRNHFLNKIVGTFSVVLEWVAPQTVNLCFSQPHHCNLFNLGMLFNIRIFCTLLWIPCSTSQSSGNYHTFSVITHPSPEYYTMILYHTTLWPPYIIKQGISFWSMDGV